MRDSVNAVRTNDELKGSWERTTKCSNTPNDAFFDSSL